MVTIWESNAFPQGPKPTRKIPVMEKKMETIGFWVQGLGFQEQWQRQLQQSAGGGAVGLVVIVAPASNCATQAGFGSLVAFCFRGGCAVFQIGV